MAGSSGFWAKVTDEVRTASDRTRRGAKRAVQIGVIRVDLISLRRERSQTLADLGERALALWRSGALSEIESDEEALRLRTRIETIEEAIEAKRAELERLRRGAKSEPPAPDQPTPALLNS
jgi:hypothetical protein